MTDERKAMLDDLVPVFLDMFLKDMADSGTPDGKEGLRQETGGEEENRA